MTQQFFDRVQIGAGIEQMSGEGMTKGVNRVVFVAKVCGVHCQVEAVLKTSAVHWLALRLPFKQVSDRTMLEKVFPLSVKRSWRKQGIAIFFAFSLLHFNAHVFTVYIDNLNAAAFFKTNSAAVKKLYDRFLFNAGCMR
jgi:hypothetical protein